MRDSPARLDAGCGGERRQARASPECPRESRRLPDRRPARSTACPPSADSLVHRDELVLAVLAPRTDDEREVDLRRRRDRSSSPSSSASRTNSSGARLFGTGRCAVTERGERGRCVAPRSASPEQRERVGKRLAPVRERSPDDLLHPVVVGQSAANGRMPRASSRPAGVAGTPFATQRACPCGWRRAGRAPRRRRTPSSPAWRRTARRPPSGPSRTTGGPGGHRSSVHDDVGGDVVRAGWRRASSRRAGARASSFMRRRTQAHVRASSSAARSVGSSERSTSTAWTCRTRSARNVVSTPRPGTDLEDDVRLVELREPADHAQDVGIDEEVLAEGPLR